VKNPVFLILLACGSVSVVSVARASENYLPGAEIESFSGTCQDYLRLETKKKKAIFRRLHAALKYGDGLKLIENTIPLFRQRIGRALQVSQERWTESNVIDENAKKEVVESVVLERMGIPVTEDIDQEMPTFQNKIASHRPKKLRKRFVPMPPVPYAEAGVLHTYGYLFSQIQTPYGQKSDRWLVHGLEEKLGLVPGSLSPFSERGEFLSNLTDALDQVVAGQNEFTKPEMVLHEKIIWRTPPGSIDFYGETSSEIELRRAVLTTRVYQLTNATALSNGSPLDRLVVYSMRFIEQSRERYVTAFPADADFAKRLTARVETEGLSIEGLGPRYNLFIPQSWQQVFYEPVFEVRGFTKMRR